MFSDKAASEGSSAGKFEWYIVVVSLVSGIIIGILVSYVVWFSRSRRSRNKIPQTQTIGLGTKHKVLKNPEAETVEADSTSQQLDLTKIIQ